MHIYHSPGSRSARPLWVLEEIGAPYGVTVLTLEERRAAPHRDRHPLGRVPVLELDDGRMMFESAGICIHVGDLYPETKLVPPMGDPSRPLLYQWVFFAMTELEPAVIAWSRARREEADETEAMERFWSLATVLDDALEGNEWLLGERFTVADVIFAKIIGLAFRRELTGDFGRLRAYSDHAQARPANVRAETVGP